MLACLASFSGACSARQVQLRGRVSEVSSGAAMRCVWVGLLDSSGTLVDSGQTVERGDFTLRAPAAGSYRLRVVHGDLSDVTSQPLRLPLARNKRQPFSIPIFLDREEIDSITADQSRRQERLMEASSRGPSYPAELFNQRVEGETIFSYTVLRDGRIDLSTIVVLHATHPAFALAVLQATPSIRYRRAVLEPNARCTNVIQPYAFRMP